VLKLFRRPPVPTEGFSHRKIVWRQNIEEEEEEEEEEYCE
jgi:hypothetical protein